MARTGTTRWTPPPAGTPRAGVPGRSSPCRPGRVHRRRRRRPRPAVRPTGGRATTAVPTVAIAITAMPMVLPTSLTTIANQVSAGVRWSIIQAQTGGSISAMPFPSSAASASPAMIAAAMASTAPAGDQGPGESRRAPARPDRGHRADREQRQRGDRVGQPDVAVLEEDVVVRLDPAGQRRRAHPARRASRRVRTRAGPADRTRRPLPDLAIASGDGIPTVSDPMHAHHGRTVAARTRARSARCDRPKRGRDEAGGAALGTAPRRSRCTRPEVSRRSPRGTTSCASSCSASPRGSRGARRDSAGRSVGS